ncbi:MAG TPA: shikimate kinase [Candidatus Dormibacteraeota bacterium]
MGAGKSTVGRLVAEAEGVPFRDLDEVIEMSVGMTIAGFFERRGEPAFREVEARLLRDLVDPEVVLALGGGTVLDDGSWRLLGERSVTVWLDAPLDSLMVRSGGLTRPLLRDRSRGEVEALLNARCARYAEARHRVDASRPLPEVVAEVRRLWAA